MIKGDRSEFMQKVMSIETITKRLKPSEL